jgi:flagellar hook-associated protein 3 FlgL
MPIRTTSLSLSRGVLSDIAKANQRLARTQERLSSLKDLNRPSDDPTRVARSMQMRTEIEGIKQHQTAVGEALGWTAVTESALGHIAEALHRVRELTIQGATDGAGPEARAAIAEELGGLLDTIKASANASYGGRYVFSGTETGDKPYQLGGPDNFDGDTARIVREIGPGVRVNVNVHGPEVIGDETGGILFTVRQIIDHLDDANPSAALTADVGELSDRLDELNAVRATIGALTNRLETADARLVEYEGTTMKILSENEDTDVAKAMIDFSIQQSALQAGLKAGASIVQTSLLDFLR